MSVLAVVYHLKVRVKQCLSVFTKNFMIWMLQNRTRVTVTVLNREGVQSFDFSKSGTIL
jgi:hypothetical protein